MIIIMIHFTGEWSTPTVIGECMLTNMCFTIKNINKTKAIIFGGWFTGGTASNDIYLIYATKDEVVSYDVE